MEYTQNMKTQNLGLLAAMALVLVATSSLYAQDLPKRAFGISPVPVYIESALKIDSQLSVKKLALDGAQAALEALEHPSFIVAGAGTGAMKLSGAGENNLARLESTPWAELQLGGNMDTTIKATVSNSFPIESSQPGALPGEKSTIKPGIIITQPLNQLLFPQADIAILKARNAVTDAMRAIAVREAECTASVLEALRDWALAQNELVQKTSALVSAQSALDSAVSLKTYKAGSSALSRLENAATLAAVAKERSQRSGQRKGELVALLCGMMPENSAPTAPLPENIDKYLIPQNNIALKKASASLELARIVYEQAWGKPSPTLAVFADLAYGISYGSNALADTSSSGNGPVAKVGAKFSYKTLDTSASLGWNNVTDTPYAELTFSWQDTNTAADRLNKQAAATELRISEIGYGIALSETKILRDDFILESELESLNAASLEALLKDSAYALAETQGLFDAGLASQGDINVSVLAYFTAQANVESAQWARVIRFARVPMTWTSGSNKDTGASNEN